MSTIPAYRKVYAEIKQMIKDGYYKTGIYLPTETELGQKFETSRTTIRRAISLLAAEGYISVMQGRGTEVRDISATQKLNCVTSFTETLLQKGYKVSTQGISVERIKADEHIAEKLKINPSDYIYHIERVQCADGNPIAIMENFLCTKLIPNFEDNHRTFLSLYSVLEKQYGIKIDDAYQTLSATSASFTKSQILLVPVGSPLLVSKRVTYSNGAPLDYSILHIIADRYSYSVYLSGR
ncbi:MAG: GntR family transcriptional regulator [Eubacteriales bacterium]|nr:GntR family transcriptional regulator [Eubacteriales bacterium]